MAYTLGKYGVSLYVLWYAFTVLARKQQTPVPDFIWNICRFYIILLFVKNTGGILSSATDAIDGLKNTLAGGDPWVWMDQLWVKVIQVATLIFDKDTSTVPVAGGIGALLTYVGGVLALLLCSIVFASAELTLLLLSVTAPIFIMCLMFGLLRQMFNSWLQLNFSSLLVSICSISTKSWDMAIKHGIKYVYCYSIRKQSSSNGSNFISCWHFHGLDYLAGEKLCFTDCRCGC